MMNTQAHLVSVPIPLQASREMSYCLNSTSNTSDNISVAPHQLATVGNAKARHLQVIVPPSRTATCSRKISISPNSQSLTSRQLIGPGGSEGVDRLPSTRISSGNRGNRITPNTGSRDYVAEGSAIPISVKKEPGQYQCPESVFGQSWKNREPEGCLAGTSTIKTDLHAPKWEYDVESIPLGDRYTMTSGDVNKDNTTPVTIKQEPGQEQSAKNDNHFKPWKNRASEVGLPERSGVKMELKPASSEYDLSNVPDEHLQNSGTQGNVREYNLNAKHPWETCADIESQPVGPPQPEYQKADKQTSRIGDTFSKQSDAKRKRTAAKRLGGGEAKRYQCDLCVHKAASHCALMIHKRVHTGEKPYECGICEYAAATKSALTRHMRIHTGEKPYECDMCEYATSRKDALTRHMRTHTGERP